MTFTQSLFWPKENSIKTQRKWKQLTDQLSLQITAKNNHNKSHLKLAEIDEEPRKHLMTVNRYICAFNIYWILGLMLIAKMNKRVIEMKRTSKEISPFGWPGWDREACMYVESLYGGQRSILAISPQLLLIRLGHTATETKYSTYLFL